jgi:Tfp pilus assembly protein PilN
MKKRVNLYHPNFHPRLNLLTLPIAIVSWILVALFCIILNFYVTSEQQKFKSEIAKINENKQQQKILVKELQSAVDNLIIDPKLLRQVAKNQQLISLKKRVLNELAGLEGLKSNGFSNLMIDLASQNQSGLWLTHINLDGMSVLMEGAATDSAIVPKWLISLGQTDYFRGQEFSDTRLYRDSDQQLKFVISTGKKPTLKKDPDND